MSNTVLKLHGETDQQETDDGNSIWNQETLTKIRDFAELYDNAKTEREEINARIQAAKSDLINRGFNKHAVEAAIKYARTEENKRENFDLSYLFCRKALGHPVQDDLFGAALKEQITVNTTGTEKE